MRKVLCIALAGPMLAVVATTSAEAPKATAAPASLAPPPASVAGVDLVTSPGAASPPDHSKAPAESEGMIESEHLSTTLPPGPGYSASKVGETLIREELVHRINLMDMQRQLEVAQLRNKIAEAEAARLKLISESQKSKEEMVPVVPVPAKAPVVGPPPVPNGGSAGMASGISVVPAEPIPTSIRFVPPPVVPTLMGTVGGKGIFKLSGETVQAGVGDTVGVFVVRTVSSTGALLEDPNDKKNKVNLQVKM